VPPHAEHFVSEIFNLGRFIRFIAFETMARQSNNAMLNKSVRFRLDQQQRVRINVEQNG
jgi:hypothetical protein